MREIEVVRKFNQSYKLLGLKYRRIVISFFLMLLTSLLEMSGLGVLYPLVLTMSGTPLDLGLEMSATQQILLLFGTVALLFLVKNVALYFTYEYNINFAMYYYRHLVQGLYQAHVYQPVLDFQKESSGSLSHNICVQTEKLVDGAMRPFLVTLSESFILAGISCIVFVMNPLLMTAILVVCGGGGFIYYVTLRPPAHRWGKHYMVVAGAQQELVQNTAGGIHEIKVFGKESYLLGKLVALLQEKTRMFHHLEMFQQAPRFLAESLFIITMMGFFSIVLLNGASPSVLIAQFSVVAAASFRILPSINRIVNSYSNFSFNIGPALEIIDTILESPISKDKEKKALGAPIRVQQNVALHEVTFHYPGYTRPILQDINLHFPPGKRIGLIGESGSGKSTLIKILAGLYPPSSGELRVDGENIAKSLKEWQCNLGYVPQESFVLPGSVLENILFGAQVQADSEEKVWNILSQVGLEPFFRDKKEGLEARIGEKGIKLSGGQKQLLSLARALFRSPQILLLDEPTASLDHDNEKLVLSAIQGLQNDCMVIMASHRHENFVGFDEIYAFEPQTKSFRRRRSHPHPTKAVPLNEPR